MKVLIGCDGSQYGEEAVAFYLRRHQPGDEVILVQLDKPKDLQQTENNNFTEGQSLVFPGHDGIKKPEAALKQRTLKYRQAAVEGKPGPGICRLARVEDASLIVIGEKTSGRLRRRLRGQVYDYVLSHSQVPVVVCTNRRNSWMKKSYGDGHVKWLG